MRCPTVRIAAFLSLVSACSCSAESPKVDNCSDHVEEMDEWLRSLEMDGVPARYVIRMARRAVHPPPEVGRHPLSEPLSVGVCDEISHRLARVTSVSFELGSRRFAYEVKGAAWYPFGSDEPRDTLWNALLVQWRDVYPPELVLFVEGDVPWLVVAEVASVARQLGWSKVGFIARAPLGQLAPGSSAMDSEIARVQSSEPIELLEASVDGYPSLFRQVSVLCPQALPALERSIGDANALDELPEALITCQCRVDVPSLKAVLWYEAGRDLGARLVSIPVRLATDHDEDGRTFRAGATEKWSEVAPRLFEAAKSGGRFRLLAGENGDPQIDKHLVVSGDVSGDGVSPVVDTGDDE